MKRFLAWLRSLFSVRGSSLQAQVAREVIELDDYRATWLTWWAACLTCGKTWVATQPADPHAGFLECPRCGHNGIRTALAPEASA